MKSDRGTLFLAIACIVFIILTIALAAAVVIDPPRSSTPGADQGPLLGVTGSQPEPARPIMKDPNYPGISMTYSMNGDPIGFILGYLAGERIFGKQLTLNNDGTLTMSCDYRTHQGTIQSLGTFTCGRWYKIKGQGHAIYFTVGGNYRPGYASISLDEIGGTATIVNKNGKDYFSLNHVDYTGGSYDDWDAGYTSMGIPADRLGPYIDCGIPADTARPYVEKGLDGDQGVPYMLYNVPPETADYFAKRGIAGDLCGPYYAAGVSNEDIVAYLDSGFTADQIMPYVRAGVSGSDVMTYLNVGALYDRAKPYIDAKAPAGVAALYAASTFPADQCMPYVNAGIEIGKSRPFMLFLIPSDQAVVYIENGISASRAKPYVDAGVPAEQAVEDIKNGIPPVG